jgi:hypothetical protein
MEYDPIWIDHTTKTKELHVKKSHIVARLTKYIWKMLNIALGALVEHINKDFCRETRAFNILKVVKNCLYRH